MMALNSWTCGLVLQRGMLCGVKKDWERPLGSISEMKSFKNQGAWRSVDTKGRDRRKQKWTSKIHLTSFHSSQNASLSSLFLLLIFLIWPALSPGQIFTRQFKFSFCRKGHGRWRRWPSFTSLMTRTMSQFSVIRALLSHDITLPVLAAGWELTDPEGDAVPLITKGNDKVSPTTQRDWRVQLVLHVERRSYSSAFYKFPSAADSSCSRVLGVFGG